MNHPTSPDPEFATPEEAAAYEKWFLEHVELGLADPGPSIPHDQVMEEMFALIEAHRAKRESEQK